MGKGGGFSKCKGVGGWVQRKTKCKSKMTGKDRSKKRSKEELRSRRIQEERATREVYGKVTIWLGQWKVWGRVFEEVEKELA